MSGIIRNIKDDINVLGIIQVTKLLGLRLRLEVEICNNLNAYST